MNGVQGNQNLSRAQALPVLFTLTHAVPELFFCELQSTNLIILKMQRLQSATEGPQTSPCFCDLQEKAVMFPATKGSFDSLLYDYLARGKPTTMPIHCQTDKGHALW
jgi:hypothetical protein